MDRYKLYFSLSRKMSRLNKTFFYIAFALERKAVCKIDLNTAIKHCKGTPLTKEQLARVKSFWKGYHVDSRWLQYFNWTNRDRLPFDERYVPSDVQYCCVYDHYSLTADSMAMDDKNMYDLYFPDVAKPRTIVRKMGGVLLDDKYVPIALESAVVRCMAEGRVICKPTVSSCGGKGILFWEKTDGENALRKLLSNGDEFIVQEVFRQHKALSDVHPSSVNTIRIMTFCDNGKVRVLQSILRMGAGGSRIDNASTGGLFCGIHDDGTLRKYACYLNGGITDVHPQGFRFEGYKIPHYEECKQEVCRLAYRFARVSKMISWDMSVAEDGTPVLIEVNLTYGGVEILQAANGPLFGDQTKEVVDAAFRRKRYRWFMRRFK